MAERDTVIVRGGDAAAPAAVLIGHSHAAAIFEAAAAQSAIRVTGPDLWAFWPDFGYDIPSDTLRPEIVAHVAGRPVFSALGGFVHALLGLVQHEVPFDFVLPGHAARPLASDAAVLPLGAVRALASHHLSHYHGYMARVRATSGGPMYHVAAPPPLADGARVLADIPWDRFPVAGKAVSPADLRWKLWRLTSDLTRAFCDAEDITVLDCPAEAFDADGFLRPELYEGAFHANANYGALVLEQMKARL